MKPSILTDWSADKARAFTHEPLQFRHRLQERLMFHDGSLVDTLRRYPRERLGVYTMGDDPTDSASWRRGLAGDLSPSELLDAARQGRIQLILPAVNALDPAYAALAAEIFADKARFAPGVRTSNRDLSLVIAAAGTQTFYQTDLSVMSSWQVRGARTVWIYPAEPPCLREEDLERLVMGEAGRHLPYEPDWDRAATRFELKPGMMATWPQGAPHRTLVQGELSVSLSVEFMTPAAQLRTSVIYANAQLRRRFGARPHVQTGLHPAAVGKAALARLLRAMDPGRYPSPLKPQFKLARVSTAAA